MHFLTDLEAAITFDYILESAIREGRYKRNAMENRYQDYADHFSMTIAIGLPHSITRVKLCEN